MKNSLLTFLFLLLSLTAICQEKDTSSKFNFDFESLEKGFPESKLKWRICRNFAKGEQTRNFYIQIDISKDTSIVQ